MNTDDQARILLLELLLRVARGEAVVESMEVGVNTAGNQTIALQVHQTELGKRRQYGRHPQ